jgi:hypothetical protein
LNPENLPGKEPEKKAHSECVVPVKEKRDNSF